MRCNQTTSRNSNPSSDFYNHYHGPITNIVQVHMHVTAQRKKFCMRAIIQYKNKLQASSSVHMFSASIRQRYLQISTMKKGISESTVGRLLLGMVWVFINCASILLPLSPRLKNLCKLFLIYKGIFGIDRVTYHL